VKSADFTYHAPRSLAEAVGILQEHGDDAKPLAGGQSLVPMLALRLTRFEHLVDLGRIDSLQGIERVGDELRIGAGTRQRAVERDPLTAGVGLLAEAVPLIGHFQIRNRGTIGGSLAHADPASELPAVALALDAQFEITGADGTRTAAARDFFVGTWTSAIDSGEILSAVRFPVRQSLAGDAIEEVARRHGDFAIAGVAAHIQLRSNGTVDRAAIAMFGMGPTPLRAPSGESALVGVDPTDAELDEIARLAAGDAEPSDDVHASGAHRTRIAAHLCRRVVRRAIEEARRNA
jgi:carbon-monoxide dehydrogenase medium subunit